MTIMEIVGWALVHSLWIGAVVAGLLFLLLRLVDARRATFRYGASGIALLVLVVAPVGAAFRMRPAETPVPAVATESPSEVSKSDPQSTTTTSTSHKKSKSSSSETSWKESSSNESVNLDPDTPSGQIDDSANGASLLAVRFRPLLPWLVLVWLIGVVALSTRLLVTWIRVQRLKSVGTTPVDARSSEVLQRLLQRLAISRPVRLLQSSIVQVPSVIGWLRPVVLVPVTLLNGLTAPQLEAILAHELAHIRRYDYLVNLFQSVVETLLFYHPAAWWISRQVRETREHCCDDLAVEVSGSPADYARALLALEESRVLALLPAATGGDLLSRVRRLVAPKLSHAETFPRWVAALVGIVAVVTLSSNHGLAAERGLPPGADNTAEQLPVFSTRSAEVTPDTVIRHPDPSAPLARRWEWARQLSAANKYPAFWIGYTIDPMPSLKGSIYISRLERRGILGSGGLDLRGRISSIGNMNGLMVPGVLLPPLVGGGDPQDVALLFAFALDRDGKPVLARVHISSLALPVDLEDRPLLWLGTASDEESVPLGLSLYENAPAKLKQDVVAAVGVHGDDRLSLPPLIRWLQGDEPKDIRTEAAEWIGRHPGAEALRVLARTARSDRVSEVRQEAAEAVGEMAFPPATDTLIVLARTLADRDARREAVEGLAERNDAKSLAAAAQVASEDKDRDVRQEAVETLGEFSNGAGVPYLLEILRKDPSTDVRQEAVETIGEAAEPDEAIRMLTDVVQSDQSENVLREAVETIGDIESTRVPTILRDLARNGRTASVRAEAVETLGDVDQSRETMELLRKIALEDRSEDVQQEAVETLSELKDPAALEMVADVARQHPNPNVRSNALESLAQEMEPEQALRVLKSAASDDRNPDVQSEAVESMGELPAELGRPALIEIARSGRNEQVVKEALETLGEMGGTEAMNVIAEVAMKNPNVEVRRDAVESIGESEDHEWALKQLDRLAREGGDVEVQREAVETIGEVEDSRVLDLLSTIAKTHPNWEVRAEAIETMTEIETSPAVVNLLTGIAMSDPSEELEVKALEALADLDGEQGVTAVIKVARSHPNREVRRKAIELLSDSEDPRAQELIDSMLQ